MKKNSKLSGRKQRKNAPDREDGLTGGLDCPGSRSEHFEESPVRMHAPDEPAPENVLALFGGSDQPGQPDQPGRAGKTGGGKKRRVIGQDELFRFFGSKKGRKRVLENVLSELTREGRLIRLKGPAYALPEQLQQMSGRISIQRQGMGFVRPEDKSGRNATDIYVHPSQLGGAWDGDRVLVALLPGRSGKNPEGRVLEVLQRSLKETAVTLLPEMVREDGKIKRLARPLDARLGGYLLVDVSTLDSGPRPDESLLVAILPENEQRRDGVIRATAVSLLGGQKTLPLHERLVKASHGISTSFPLAVLDECAALPAELDAEALGLPGAEPLEAGPFGAGKRRGKKFALRRDLRQTGFVTIDGADARDFDDAIQVEAEGAGYLLRVAIADVAHYVRPGSALDAEALERGNSCYFPASVEPMLPEALSNGLCSLKPDLPRLAMVAEISFNAKGEPGQSSFYPALIQSRARLTYEEVHAAMDLADPDARQKLGTNLPMLETAAELARILIRQRSRQGSLSFDLPEPDIKLNAEGAVSGLEFRQRHFSHKLIEEFMIAANEAVARHLESLGENFLYRVHPAPDPEKLHDFFQVLSRNGLLQSAGASPPGVSGAGSGPEFRRAASARKGGPKTHPSGASSAPGAGDLQALLDQARGRPEEYVVNRLLLRSLMQARYTPVAEGHFGLGSEAYCHFTSPIRRYADLTVHRVLRRSLGLAEKTPGREELMNIADSLNESERNAVEAERDIHKISAALFLEPHIGEEFPAVVSGLSSFGLFVELEGVPAEGFLPVEELADDFYHLDSERQMLVGLRNGKLYRLGQRLLVILDKADPARLEIRFALSPDSPPETGKAGRGNGKSSGKSKKNTGSEKSGRKNNRTRREKLKPGSVRVRKGR